MPTNKTRAGDGLVEAHKRIESCRKMHSRGYALDLSGLGLNALPPEIGHLKALTTLNLAYNELLALPSEIGHLKALTSLDLANNNLIALPPEIGQLSALTHLYLNLNQLIALPSEIVQLSALVGLYLDGNQLTTLPLEICRLTSLIDLSVWNNRLTALPPEIGRLTMLKNLLLGGNQFTTLPPEISQLRGLATFNFSSMQLTLLPPEIGQLSALTYFVLNSNGFTELPPEIGQLSALRWLVLYENELITLPAEIGQLSALTSLALHDNKLITLPAEIGQLSALTELDLHCNMLTTLPPEIGHLKALTTLNLASNKLIALPPEIEGLSALNELYLHDNPGLGLPVEMLGPTSKEVRFDKAKPKSPGEILDYYFCTRGPEGRVLREVKLILVGRGEVGKSSIADVLQGKRFIRNRKRTDGIAISSWEAKLSNGPAKILIWDFGGQEILHGTHQFFLTHRSLYVVVVDGRHDRHKQDAEYWLKLARAFGGQSSVVVVMNRQKAHPFDMDRQYLAEKYGVKLEHFFPTDCEMAGSVKPVRRAILKEAERILSLEERFPATCWDVKDRLASMNEDYLSDEEYANICKEYGVTDEMDQQKLLHRLADLGTVVSFPDEIKLKELSVLNPEWVTDGIYRVITNRILRKGKHGKLTLKTLRELLPKKRWPKPNHLRYLLDLMEKFELCFPLEDEDDGVLVSELLPDETPPLSDWDAAECVVFLYKYTILPHGVLPRFITKTHSLSKGRLRWRSGVVVGNEDAEALIKADYDANVLSVWVRGSHSDARRALLNVVRYNFDQIHGRIKDLNPKEEVAVSGRPDVTVPYRDLILDSRAGKTTVRLTIDGERVDRPISGLLDGVELPADREKAYDRFLQESGATHHHHYSPGARVEFMRDKKTAINVRTNFGQIAEVMTNCTNMIQMQPSEERRAWLEELQRDAKKLIESLPADKKDEAPKVAKNLELLVKEATSDKPDRKWYSVSAEGLLEASNYVKDFTGNIAGTIKSLGKAIWPDFHLPEPK